jgi:hypothetical protein
LEVVVLEVLMILMENAPNLEAQEALVRLLLLQVKVEVLLSEEELVEVVEVVTIKMAEQEVQVIVLLQEAEARGVQVELYMGTQAVLERMVIQ